MTANQPPGLYASNKPKLLIVSSSGRAIAQTALKAGYPVDVFDLFNDWDLENFVNTGDGPIPSACFSLSNKDDLFVRTDLSQYAAAVIAGGVETDAVWVRRLEGYLPILGCPADQLDRLHSPPVLDRLPSLVESTGAMWPASQARAPFEFEPGEWLIKSLRGSGGGHVQFWTAETASEDLEPAKFFQRYIRGRNISALLVASNPRSAIPVDRPQLSPIPTKDLSDSSPAVSCRLLGCSQQLVGEVEFGASPFAYCGSLGPIEMAADQVQIIQKLGTSIANEFQLRGVFGMDLILHEQGIWLIDINPRIPASAEIFERSSLASGTACHAFSVFATHVQACLGDEPAQRTVFCSNPIHAKGVLFCRSKNGMTIDDRRFRQIIQRYGQGASPKDCSESCQSLHQLADIPKLGTQIPQGHPILTFFATGDFEQQARDRLSQFSSELNTMLDNGPDHRSPCSPTIRPGERFG